MRNVVLPDVKSFNDLFEVVERDVKKAPPPYLRRSIGAGGTGDVETMKIGSYLCFSSAVDGETWRDALYVKPTKLCLEAILANMIMIDHDTTHFNVVVRDGHEALVICSFGLIIGSVWLAMVDLATVPDTREPGVPAAVAAEGDG